MIRLLTAGVLAICAVGDARADGQCDYLGEGFSESADFSGVCVEATSVPAGCPVYFVVEHATTVAYGPPTAVFGSATSMTTATTTTTLIATADQQVSAVDVPDSNCNCDPVISSLAFDQFRLDVTGAQVDDGVTFAFPPNTPHTDAQEAQVSFTAAAPCPPAAWPTAFAFRAPCDRCPTPIDPGPDPTPSPTSSSGGGGCAASAGGGPLLALLAIVLCCGLRRRR